MLTQECLKRLLTYDPLSGIFTWADSRNNAVKVGQKAGVLDKDSGYIRLCVDGRSYRAHRLAWLYFYGAFPKDQIDHIDCNKVNNAISNLREAKCQQNHQNRKIPKSTNTTSSYLGVRWFAPRKKWAARITTSGKEKHLGYFETEIDAANAYRSAKRIQHEYCTI